MTTAIAAYNPVDKDAADERDDLLLAVARMNAAARRGDAVVDELKQPWRFTEEEVANAAITVIFVALVAMMGVAALAILTMG